MLLRRITKHIENQNWFAVGLDFSIVVLGVFVGLQVQNWANERGRQEMETSYTLRLHDEVMQLESTRAPLTQTREDWRTQLESVAVLFYGDMDRLVSASECEAVGYSYIVSNPTDDLASLIELQQSGRLSIFRNEQVSSALNHFLLTRARARDSQAAIAATSTILMSDYPELIKVIKNSERHMGDNDFASYECDLDAMRTNNGFLNDFQLTQSNFNYHVSDNRRITQSLAKLHQTLDTVLGIDHTKTAADN